jgi:hypothetical protein
MNANIHYSYISSVRIRVSFINSYTTAVVVVVVAMALTVVVIVVVVVVDKRHEQ